MLQIVADENIPNVHEFFDEFGQVTTKPGRTLCAKDLEHADILLVRSVTNVNQSLLDRSPVKFVGTCTIGIDHLDLDFLGARQISYASAPGCNAGGVVQYDIAAISQLNPNWQSLSFGIVAGGNVGGRVSRILHAMGVSCCVYDPFLSVEQHPLLTDLETVLGCDVVCFHAPYTTTGPHPTHHLLNAENISLLKDNAILLNAGRGGSIDNLALLETLKHKPELQVVLDVWEHEPQVNLDLLKRVNIATPHIAGYSFEGRLMGSAMIYSAMAQFLGRDADEIQQTRAAILEKILGEPNSVEGSDINTLIAATYDIMADDRRMRESLLHCAPNQIGPSFDFLRKTYPERREFLHYRASAPPSCHLALRSLGFMVE